MSSGVRSIKRKSNEKADTKSKLVKTQSNTLFNYFNSSKTTTTKITKIETNAEKSTDLKKSVDSDLEIIDVEKTESIKLEVVKNEIVESSESDPAKNTDCKQAWLKIFTKTEKVDIKNETNDDFDTPSEETKRVPRKCPFYKFIANTQITVDAFNFGVIENCKAYFLSHFHYDHYMGLNKHFQQTMYCSEITGNLVEKVIKVNPKYIRKLELNKFQNVFDDDQRTQVALLDANHCPGSVMFLFYFKDTKRYILHTGDFRAGKTVIEDPLLQNINVDMLYLDTTYRDSYYKFEPQDVIVALGVRTIKEELKKYPESLIVCGSYTIGKERIFTSIANEISVKIYVRREKKNILDCLNDHKLKALLTLDPNETNLHVLPMNILNMNDLTEYLAKFPAYKRIIAIKPTGWTHNSDASLSVEAKKPNAIIYGLAYSEHSSFTELKTFVKFLKPKRILPTVNNSSKTSRDKMTSYFQEWLQQ